MKRMFLLLVAAVLIAAPIPSLAGGHGSYFTVRDATPDAWVWVTIYSSHMFGDKIRASYCVKPGETSRRDVQDYTGKVRVEVTKTNCAHPVMLGASLDARGNRSDSPIVTHFYGEVSGSNGHYAFRRTNF